MPARALAIAAVAATLLASPATVLLTALTISATLAPAARAEDAAWKSFSRPALGFSISRPADLYESDPEAPADHVSGEVEWASKDQAWTILVTSQALEPSQTLASMLADEKQRNPEADAAAVRIGDGIDAVKVTALDEDTLSVLVLLLDKTGKKLIAIELAIALTEEDIGKPLSALRLSYNGTLAMFDRMLTTVRIAKE